MTGRRLLALVAVAVVVWLLFPGKYPYGVQIDNRITLEFDGEPIVLERYRSCTRSENFGSDGTTIGFFDSRGGLYDCGPEWFATRLKDGDGLLLGAVGYPTYYQDRGGGFVPGPCTHLPTVFWVDDAVAPTRGEFTFSEVALSDPRSRVRALRCEVVSISTWSHFVAPLRGLVRALVIAITGSERDRQSVNPTIVAPWLAGLPDGPLEAYYMSITPEALWQAVANLEDALASLRGPTLIGRNDPIASFLRASQSASWPMRLSLPVSSAMVPADVNDRFFLKGGIPASSVARNLLYLRILDRGDDGKLRLTYQIPQGVLAFTRAGPLSPSIDAALFEALGISQSDSSMLQVDEVRLLESVLYLPSTHDLVEFSTVTFPR